MPHQQYGSQARSFDATPTTHRHNKVQALAQQTKRNRKQGPYRSGAFILTLCEQDFEASCLLYALAQWFFDT